MSDRGFVGAPVEIVTGYLTVAKIKIKNPRYVFGDGKKIKKMLITSRMRERKEFAAKCVVRVYAVRYAVIIFLYILFKKKKILILLHITCAHTRTHARDEIHTFERSNARRSGVGTPPPP